jgi:hypothetical protein
LRPAGDRTLSRFVTVTIVRGLVRKVFGEEAMAHGSFLILRKARWCVEMHAPTQQRKFAEIGAYPVGASVDAATFFVNAKVVPLSPRSARRREIRMVFSST